MQGVQLCLRTAPSARGLPPPPWEAAVQSVKQGLPRAWSCVSAVSLCEPGADVRRGLTREHCSSCLWFAHQDQRTWHTSLAKSTNLVTFHKSPAGKHLEKSVLLTVTPNSTSQNAQNTWAADLSATPGPALQETGCEAALACLRLPYAPEPTWCPPTPRVLLL